MINTAMIAKMILVSFLSRLLQLFSVLILFISTLIGCLRSVQRIEGNLHGIRGLGISLTSNDESKALNLRWWVDYYGLCWR